MQATRIQRQCGCIWTPEASLQEEQPDSCSASEGTSGKHICSAGFKEGHLTPVETIIYAISAKVIHAADCSNPRIYCVRNRRSSG
jgi:hypothetical protein